MKIKSSGRKSLKKGPSHGETSAEAFAGLVNRFKAEGPRTCPLTDFTFFLGAGFSKAWSNAYPVGAELFHVPEAARASLENVERAANFSGIAPGDLDMNQIKQLVYTLDMSQRYPAIRSRYVDDQNILAVKNELRAFFCSKFLSMVGRDWYWFDSKEQKFRIPRGLTHEQQRIRLLFSEMFDLIDGSQGFMQGARFNFITTNYDWLVETIFDSACGDDEPGLLYLYRGITPRETRGFRDEVVAHEHDLVFNLLKINGGFEIFREGESYDFDYLPKTKEELISKPPTLILPSREQDYLSDYFTAMFPKAVRLLHESKVLVLVGYSLPEEDALLRFIIRQFCEDVADAPRKVLFYVDMAEERELLNRLTSVFPFAGTILPVGVHSGSFSEWAAQVAAAIS